jgi:hypothetical protein
VYVQLPAPERLKAIMAAWNCLAPDGICWSSRTTPTDNLTNGVGGPQDPDVLYSDRDAIAGLGAMIAWREWSAPSMCPVRWPGSTRPALDTVVRARKLGPDA